MEKHPLYKASITMLATITTIGCTLTPAIAADPTAGDMKTLSDAPTVIIGQPQSDAKTDGTTVGAEPSGGEGSDEKSFDKLPAPSTGAESDGKGLKPDDGDAAKPDASIENGKLNTTDPDEQQATGNKNDQPQDNGTAESDTKNGDVDKSDETGKPSDVGNPEDKPQQTVQPKITVANPTIARQASDGELTTERIIQMAGATAPEGYGITIDAKQVETLNNAYWDYAPLEFDVTLQLTKDGAIVAGAPTAIAHFSISAPGTGKLHLDHSHVTVRADEGPVTVETLLECSGARIGIPDAYIGIHPDQVDLVNQQIAGNEAGTVTVAVQAMRFGILDVEYLEVEVIPVTVTAHDFTWDVSDGSLLTDRIVELSKATVDGRDYRWDVPVVQTRSLNDLIHYGKVGKVKVDVTAWRGEGRPMASTTITITLTDKRRAAKQGGTLAQTGADASGVLVAGLSLVGMAAGVELARRRMR